MPQSKIHITVISNAGSGSRQDVEISADMNVQQVVSQFIGSGQEMTIRVNGRKVDDPQSTTLSEGDRVTIRNPAICENVVGEIRYGDWYEGQRSVSRSYGDVGAGTLPVELAGRVSLQMWPGEARARV